MDIVANRARTSITEDRTCTGIADDHAHMDIPANAIFCKAESTIKPARAFTAALLAVIAMLSMLFLLLSAPMAASAYASYSNPSITSVAQVRTNGSLHVAERRSFAFDEPYTVLTWSIRGLPADSTVSIESVRLSHLDSEGNITTDWYALNEVNYESGWRGIVSQTEGKASAIDAYMENASQQDEAVYVARFPEPGSFAFDDRNDQIYVFIDPTTDLTVIDCDYLAAEAVAAFDDVAELYWDYVEAKDDAETQSVRVQVQLPVPEGAAVVAGENVMAWGHGPEGRIFINEDGTIDYEVDDVLAGQYAQAHIVFPVKWLSNITVQQRFANSGVRFDAARLEETRWLDSYSAGLINGYVISIAYCAICIVLLIAAMCLYALFGRAHRPAALSREACNGLLETYGLPIAARTVRWNYWSSDDFALMLQTLIDKGAIVLDESSCAAAGSPCAENASSCAGSASPDVSAVSSSSTAAASPFATEASPLATAASPYASTRLRMAHDIKNIPLTKIEQKTLHIVFSEIGLDYQSVSIDDILKWCALHPNLAREELKSWQELLSRNVVKANVFDRKSIVVAKSMGIACAGLLAWAAWLLISGAAAWQTVLFLITGVIVGCIAYNTPRRTQSGKDLEYAASGCAESAERLHLKPWQVMISTALDNVAESDGSVKTARSIGKSRNALSARKSRNALSIGKSRLTKESYAGKNPSTAKEPTGSVDNR